MAEYSTLANLRADLTADDPDERASAYSSVLEADLEVSEVLASNPPEKKLAKAGVIPKPEDENRKEAAQYREKQVELLKEIRDAVTDSSKTTNEGK